MSRECRKCGKVVPNHVKIDGIDRNLQSRKFCLECSPYNGHNTSRIIPFSKKSRVGRYSTYTEEQKSRIKLVLYKRGLERKSKLIELSGGKCVKCGYSKCSRALSFHHRNPSDKKFPLSLNFIWSKPWQDIYDEWEKCDLLCMNCHTELEYDLLKKDENNTRSMINKMYGTNY